MKIRLSSPSTITGKNHPDTSYLAAEKALGRSGSQRRRVYEYIVDCGTYGATDDEISEALDIPSNSVRPRRVEIWDLRLIARNGKTRINSNGNQCDVWVAR